MNTPMTVEPPFTADMAARLLYRSIGPNDRVLNEHIRRVGSLIRIVAERGFDFAVYHVLVLTSYGMHDTRSTYRALADHLRQTGFYVTEIANASKLIISWRYSFIRHCTKQTNGRERATRRQQNRRYVI